MINEIYAIIIAAAPALTAVIGIIFAVIKGIRNNKDISGQLLTKFEEMKKEALDTKEYKELKAQFKIVNEENLILKQKINELLTAITKIQSED